MNDLPNIIEYYSAAVWNRLTHRNKMIMAKRWYSRERCLLEDQHLSVGIYHTPQSDSTLDYICKVHPNWNEPIPEETFKRSYEELMDLFARRELTLKAIVA
jgi:hypothetical protein